MESAAEIPKPLVNAPIMTFTAGHPKMPVSLNKRSGVLNKKMSKFDQGTGLDSMM